MSSVIISFDKGRPKADCDKVKEEKQLNETIRSFIKGSINSIRTSGIWKKCLDYVDELDGGVPNVETVWGLIKENEDIAAKSSFGLFEKRGLIVRVT